MRIAFVREALRLALLRVSRLSASISRCTRLRFGVIALVVRSFERPAMSHRRVISNYAHDDRHESTAADPHVAAGSFNRRSNRARVRGVDPVTFMYTKHRIESRELGKQP